MGLNRIIIAGRLAADPEIRYTKNETAVASFRLAINRSHLPEKNGPEFFNCLAWNGLAKVIGEYLKKGKLVAVEGRLQVRSHKNKKGLLISNSEIMVENLQMLDSKFYTAAEKEEKQ